jgi:hypothetical protein
MHTTFNRDLLVGICWMLIISFITMLPAIIGVFIKENKRSKKTSNIFLEEFFYDDQDSDSSGSN